MSVSLKEIAELVSGRVVGDPATVVSGVSSIQEAGPGDIVFAESDRLIADAERSEAAAVLMRDASNGVTKPAVMVTDPRSAFAAVLEFFAPKAPLEAGTHPTAFVDPTADVAPDASVGFGAYIGEGTTVASGAKVWPLAFIGAGCSIGEGSIIFPNVTLYANCRIGKDVAIHSGSVIGADGFGYNQADGRHHKVPHIGGVDIADFVEIGANVTIDRARTGLTEIGEGTKIDNLVHIAHNVKIGKHCIIVAQVGISGSVTIGEGVVLAGQAGIKDHVSVGSGSQVAARAGIISDVAPGSKIAGFPAKAYGDQMRIWATEPRLPELAKQVDELQKQVAELLARLGETAKA